ncbi:MAG TPA: type II toxin-antitoxin system PemK/MazF family toxin [Mycobacterium sp.]|nr:type II toxin-antitoxin system PemK/MazF family toxin [Mycobacterium sp.]HTX96715.1 type II toxin-antitoxin system PemK/MazF family toxin [Mycobacterium sp.]
MRRGDIYTAAARGAYSGKPRPVVLIQDDRFDATASVTVVPFTTSDVDAPLLRVAVQPSDTIGLAETSRLMIDKATTVPRTSLTRQVGRLSDGDLVRLDRALLVFLGLAV